jgi:hypothetical protein
MVKFSFDYLSAEAFKEGFQAGQGRALLRTLPPLNIPLRRKLIDGWDYSG